MGQYPSDQELETIATWDHTDFHGLMQYIEPIWEFADVGYFEFHKDTNSYSLHTGGWSGNEDIIGAMNDNLTWWLMYWESSIRGGHFIFRPIGGQSV
jgi:hypothetical protein